MKSRFLNKNYILTVLLSAIVYVASNMFITALPRYAVGLGQSKLTVGSLMLVYTLSACATRILWGRMADRYGRMAVIYLGIVLNIAASAIMLLKGDIVLLFISRGIFGAGFSAVITACATLATEVVAAKHMSKAIAIYGLGGVLTQAIAPPLALYLFSYGLPLVATVAIGLLGVSFIIAIGIKIPRGNPSRCVGSMFEKSAVSPSVVAGIITFSTAGIFSFVPLLTGERSIESVSGFFIANSIGLLISRLVFTKVSENISHSKLFYIGIVIFTAGFLLLSFTKDNISLVFAGLLYGYGLGSVHPILNTQAVSNAKKENRAGAMAVFYTFQDMGVAAGSIVCGLLADIFTLKAVFLTCAAVAISSAIPYFFSKNKK